MVVRLTGPTFTVHKDDLRGEAPDGLEGRDIFIRGLPYKIREQNLLGHGRIELRLLDGEH